MTELTLNARSSSTPFPIDPVAKRQLFEELKVASPELVADINAVRAAFPGATVKHLTFNGKSYGKPSAQGIVPNVDVPSSQRTTALSREQERLAKHGRDAKKRK